jgi:flagellar basal body rod protein FlgG
VQLDRARNLHEEQIAPAVLIDHSSAKLQVTGVPLDLAIEGDGFFVLQSEADKLLTRDGRFRRDADGRVVNKDGLPVLVDGSDLVLKSENVTVLADGMILDGGEPAGKLDVVAARNVLDLREVGAYFVSEDSNLEPAQAAALRQGMIETSNVSMTREVTSMMRSQRQAETGQQIIRLYDDLMARAITTFGQN